MQTKEEILKQYFGYDGFREGQEWLIDHILKGENVVGVMPTGAGKSICFQVPAMMFEGITLVISPLISLMKDQVNALTQSGISAAFINSSLTQNQYNTALENAKKGQYKIIYVAPERLLTEDFLYFAKEADISMVTIDEAHCISQWGQDFRPSYVKIIDFIRSLPQKVIVSAFTATATKEVREDIIHSLQLYNPQILVTGFDRKNLYFEVQRPDDKFSALTGFLQDKKDKTGIVYCSTRKTVEEVAAKLNQRGCRATQYHAGLSDQERVNNQEDFIYDRCPIIVATNAFGMGIDKSNVSFVVHYNMPKNIESYYQEAGRAGRDGEPADCILLYGGQDVRTNMYFIENNRDAEYADKATEMLVKERDRQRLKEMTFYCHTNDCLREYILKYFADKTISFCGNCGNCHTNFETIDITVDAQKILSCIKRTGARYGIVMICNILRGSKNERLMSLGLDQVSTYGIMNTTTEKRIRAIINQLVLDGYIFITNDEYPIVKLTDRAAEVLFGRKQLEMKLAKEYEKKPKAIAEKKTAKISPVHPELMEILKNVRTDFAKKQKVPAFVIFSDASLRDMCMKLPANEAEFLNISGVGQVKLEKFGAAFLQKINEFISGVSEGHTQNAAEMIVIESVSSASDFEEFCQYMNTQKPNMEFYDEPVPISIFTDMINGIIATKYIKKISPIKTADWLVTNGYLQILYEDGQNKKMPTALGTHHGITSELKTDRYNRSYHVNLYSRQAQELLVENLESILRFAESKKKK